MEGRNRNANHSNSDINANNNTNVSDGSIRMAVGRETGTSVKKGPMKENWGGGVVKTIQPTNRRQGTSLMYQRTEPTRARMGSFG